MALRRLTLIGIVGAAAFAAMSRQIQDDAASPPAPLVEAIVHTRLGPPNWDVYLFEEPGTPPRRLARHPALDYNAVFSPDGRWVVFTSERTGSAELYALDLEGENEAVRLTNHPAMDDAASFSPDGRRLAFVSTRDGDADVFVMPFSPADPTAESRAVNLTHRPGATSTRPFPPTGARSRSRVNRVFGTRKVGTAWASSSAS